MRVQIDEPGGHHQPFHVQHSAAFQRRRRHRSDSAGANPDIPHGIEIRFRIHHAPVRQHNVVGLRRQPRSNRKQPNGQSHLDQFYSEV